MPSARPRAEAGASREVSDGKLASRMLKATKNTSIQKASAVTVGAKPAKPSCTTDHQGAGGEQQQAHAAAPLGHHDRGIISAKDASTAGR